MQPNILICTVGTSLFRPNLETLKRERQEGKIRPELVGLAEAYEKQDWAAVARELGTLPPSDRTCGAEINSIASMIERGYVPANCGLFFLHSDTPDGKSIGVVLRQYFQARGHAPVETICVPDLQDQDPKRFRTKGLRNLARYLCRIIRQYSPATCAINATGGYKAQIAIAVVLGQAIGVPVYYKHELFSEIIAFPALPVALDLEVWMRASGMLFDLERSPEPIPAKTYEDEWDEKYESLVERVSIDNVDYLELSPTGQIFHETFRHRFQLIQDRLTPPAVAPEQKQKPRLEKAGWRGEHPEVQRFLERVTAEVPQVIRCETFYYNPDLPQRTRFRLSSKGIEGIYSDGTFTVKFAVRSSARTRSEEAAVVALLNDWLHRQYLS
ncbi:MAG: putative CRISPR-associated protein [Thermoguttaceae bacterium]|nr:putative CRISPR-associated protein [Thermoguttaceae bacterium]MDW8079520.1 putative CRISPR-associated protein [Thermoguttaceae bacterium]